MGYFPSIYGDFYALTLARFPYFATFASGGEGGWYDPPGDRPLMVVELRGKKQSTRLDEISRFHIFFSPRSTFDLVRSGQRSNFRKK